MDFDKSGSIIDVEIAEVSVTPPLDPAKAEIFGAVERAYLKLHGRVGEMRVSLSYESDEDEESGKKEGNKSEDDDDDDDDAKSTHTEDQDKDHKGNNVDEKEGAAEDDTSDTSEQSLSSDMKEEADFVPRYRFTHKQTGEMVKNSAWMDYYMPAKRVAAIKEVLLLYWGEVSSHHVFLVLLASGEENTYERIGIVQYASDGDVEEMRRILSWLEPWRDLIFI